MTEQAYFEQFSGYHSHDDAYWDEWYVISESGFRRSKPYQSLSEAVNALDKILTAQPELKLEIQYVERAGFDAVQLKHFGPYLPLESPSFS